MAHCMRNLPTVTVLAERSAHRNIRLSTQYLLCDSGPEMAHHLWEYPVHSHMVHGPAAPAHVANHLHRAMGFTDTGPVVGLRRPRTVVGGNHHTIPTSGSHGNGGATRYRDGVYPATEGWVGGWVTLGGWVPWS